MTQQPLVSHSVALRTWPGHSSQVGERLARLAEATRPLKGCLCIVAHRDPGDTRLWYLDMTWADDQALGRWLADTLADLFADLIRQYLVMHLDFQPGATDFRELQWRRAG
jgi:quinol monooxygenase YgiN